MVCVSVESGKGRVIFGRKGERAGEGDWEVGW
jgi:hypothetical protein